MATTPVPSASASAAPAPAVPPQAPAASATSPASAAPAAPAAAPVAPSPAVASASAQASVKVPSDDQASEPSESRPIFDPTSISYYTAGFELSLPHQDFGNDKGYDHTGLGWRLSAGPKLIFGDKDSLKLKLFYDRASVSSDEGQGLTSEASVRTMGLAADYTHTFFPMWLAPFVGVEVGDSKFYSEGSNHFDPSTQTLTQTGARFNKNPGLAPLDDHGLHIGFSLGDCFLKSALCAGARFYWNKSVDPAVTTSLADTSGQNPVPSTPQSLSVPGWDLFLNLDVLAAYDGLFGKHPAPKATPAASESRRAAPLGAEAPLGGTATLAPAASVETAAKAQGVDELVAEIEKSAGDAKTAADIAANHLSDLNAELEKKAPTSTAGFYVSDSMTQSRAATLAVVTAQKDLETMTDLATKDTDEGKKAKQALPKAKAKAAEASRYATAAYKDAKAAYTKYNASKKVDDKEKAKIKFDLEEPPVIKAPQQGGGGAKKAAPAALKPAGEAPTKPADKPAKPATKPAAPHQANKAKPAGSGVPLDPSIELE